MTDKKYTCPACGSKEVWRGPWPDFSAYVGYKEQGDAPIPTCVEFKCGTRKLIEVDQRLLDDYVSVRDRYRCGYFSQQDKCQIEQLKQKRRFVREFLREARFLTYEDIKQLSILMHEKAGKNC